MASDDYSFSFPPICSVQNQSFLNLQEKNQYSDACSSDRADSYQETFAMRALVASSVEQMAAPRLSSFSLNLSVETIKYKNGFTVQLDRNPFVNDVYAVLVVKTGSKNDPLNHSGMAHCFEHMAFKGTTKIGTTDYPKEKELLDKIKNKYEELRSLDFNHPANQSERQRIQQEISQLSTEASKYATVSPLDVLYSSIGLQSWNAQTLRDYTQYFFQLPADMAVIERWVKVLPEVSSNNVFRLFQPEIAVVVEEWERAMRRPKYALESKTLELLFPTHPYGRSVLGKIDNLQNPSIVAMEEFYKKHFVPEKMVLVLSGNFDLPKTKEILEKNLSAIPKSTFSNNDSIKSIPKIEGVIRGNVDRRGEEAVSVAFQIPSPKSQDYPALLILHRLLDGQEGKYARLDKSLVGPKKIATGRAFAPFYEESGVFRLEGRPVKDQTLEEVEHALIDELKRLTNPGNINANELKTVIFSYEQELKRELEKSDFRGTLIAEAAALGVNPNHALKTLKAMKKLTPAEVQAVATEYFGNNYVVVYRHNKAETNPPKLEKLKIGRLIYSDTPETALPFTKGVIGTVSSSSKISPVNYSGKNKDFQVHTIAPGVLLYYAQNRQNDLGSLSIRYNYGSSRLDREFCVVMNERSEASLVENDKTFSPSELKERFNSLGMSVGQTCSEGRFELQLNGPDRYLKNALSLSSQLLWHPKIDPVHFKAAVKRMNQKRELEPSDPEIVSDALTDYILRREKSPYLDRLANSELTVFAELDAQAVYNERLQRLSQYNYTVFYTGSLSLREVTQLVKENKLSDSTSTPLISSGPQPDLVKYEPLTEGPQVKIYFTPYEDVQAKGYIRLIIPEEIEQGDNKKIASAQLLNAFLGHDFQGDGVMWQIFRDKKGGLVYSPDARYILGSRLGDQGRFEMNIMTQAEKIPDVFETALELFRKFPINREEFEIKRELLKATLQFEKPGLRDLFPKIQQWAQWGYRIDPRPAWVQALEKLTYEEFKTYLQQVLQSRKFVFTVVTDPQRFNPEGLKKFGAVKKIDSATLFKN